MFSEWQVSIHPSSCLSHLSQDESDASPGGHARHLGSIACNHCQGLLELAHREVYCLLHSHREYTPHLFRLCIVLSCIALWASHTYSHRGIQRIRNAFIINNIHATTTVATVGYFYLSVHSNSTSNGVLFSSCGFCFCLSVSSLLLLFL